MYNVVSFFGREHGLEGFKSIIESKEYNPLVVFTHKYKAKFEDPERGLRPDFEDYQKIAEENNILLFDINSRKEVPKIDEILQDYSNIDYIVAISWRFLIPKQHLDLPKITGINLHRGRLRENDKEISENNLYPGNFPLVRALENGEKEVYIAAHILEEKIDAGDVIKQVKHPVNYNSSKTLDENVERLKKELTPYFGPLLIDALKITSRRSNNE